MANARTEERAAGKPTEPAPTAANRAMLRETLPPPRTLDQQTRAWFGVSSTVAASCLAGSIMLGSALAMYTAPSRTHRAAAPADPAVESARPVVANTAAAIELPSEPVAPTPPPALDPGTPEPSGSAAPAPVAVAGEALLAAPSPSVPPPPAAAPGAITVNPTAVANNAAPAADEAATPTHHHHRHGSHDSNSHAVDTQAPSVAGPQPSTAPSPRPRETAAPPERAPSRTSTARPARSPAGATIIDDMGM